MTLRHLKTFIAVCGCGGITKAAEELHVAQPAVSNTISEIEKYYNVVLFERIGQRLMLTDSGKELLEKAKEAVSAFDDFEKTANRAENNVTLKIGATLTIGKLYVPALLTSIKRDFADIQVKITINRASQIEEMLLRGALDFALSESQSFSPQILKKEFAEDRLTAVCGAKFAAKDEISLTELSKYPLLLREKGSASRELTDKVIGETGITASPLIESASNQALIAAAAENHGIAVLPQKLVQPYIDGGILKTIRVTGIDFKRKYCVIYHKNKKFGARQRQAFEMCLNSL